jgi:recombination associated protein RdgC
LSKKTKNIWDSYDFLELWQEKLFLGQEFLTWLWLSSEVDNRFSLNKGQFEVEVWFEKTLKLESGQGDSLHSVTCQLSNEPTTLEWAEAFISVINHNKVNSGRLKIKTPEREWSMTLSGHTLAPKSVKLTAGANFSSEGGDLSLTGQLLDRVASFAELNTVLEALFTLFIELRLSKAWEEDELPRLRSWVLKWAEQARGQ